VLQVILLKISVLVLRELDNQVLVLQELVLQERQLVTE